MRLEGAALADEARHTPQHVPALYSYDATMALIVMQYIKPPAIILRKGLCQVGIEATQKPEQPQATIS